MALQPTVYIVDDDKASRQSVQALVASMDVRARVFESAEEFLEAYDPAEPGCLVTDLRMLGMSGVELLEKLRSRQITIPTIVLSAFADVPVTVKAMQLGAVTLLEKPCREMELWDAIRKALLIESDSRTKQERIQELRSRLALLTPQEARVLELITQGVPNKAIAHRINVSLRTVEARRKSIFKKTGTRSVAELVRLVEEAKTPL